MAESKFWKLNIAETGDVVGGLNTDSLLEFVADGKISQAALRFLMDLNNDFKKIAETAAKLEDGVAKEIVKEMLEGMSAAVGNMANQQPHQGNEIHVATPDQINRDAQDAVAVIAREEDVIKEMDEITQTESAVGQLAEETSSVSFDIVPEVQPVAEDKLPDAVPVAFAGESAGSAEPAAVEQPAASPSIVQVTQEIKVNQEDNEPQKQDAVSGTFEQTVLVPEAAVSEPLTPPVSLTAPESAQPAGNGAVNSAAAKDDQASALERLKKEMEKGYPNLME